LCFSARSFPVSVDSTSASNVQGCASSGNPKSTPIAEPSSESIGPTFPATKTSETSEQEQSESISSAGASRASQSRLLDAAKRKLTKDGSGPNSSVLLASYDHVTSSWRTCLDWRPEDSGLLLDRLPRSGLTRTGTLFLRPRSVPRISENASSWWPTPTVSDGMGGPGSSGRQGGENLRTRVGGQLNPEWIEWLMGFPPGHTVLEPSEMPSSRKSPNTSDD
jgi:hypothetical protein